MTNTETLTLIVVGSPKTLRYQTSSWLLVGWLNEAIAQAAGLFTCMLVIATIFFPSGISKSKTICA